MKLEQQVTSAELSIKLKTLGLIVPSLFFREWTGAKDSEIEEWGDHKSYFGIDNVNCYTVAELGEMLPAGFRSGRTRGNGTDNGGYVVIVEDANEQSADSEADARAKMLIHLLENKLITL
jgi:hypothetical protein